MPRAVNLPMILLCSAVAACGGAQRASTVPSADRLPDRVEDDCRHKPDDSLPPEVLDRMCFCVAREYQRTMPAKDAFAFGEAFRAAGDDAVARNRLIMNNETTRRAVATCEISDGKFRLWRAARPPLNAHLRTRGGHMRSLNAPLSDCRV